MKIKTNPFFSSLIALIAVLGITAFQAGQSPTLIGSWKVKSFQAAYPDTMSNKAKAAAELDMKDLGARLKKSILVFNQDGSLSYLGHKGRWMMNTNGKTVDFISSTNEKSLITIVKLSQKDFVFKRVDDGITQTFHLTRYVKEIH